MNTHLELTDFEFEQRFAEHTIPPSVFSHEAHLRLAFMHIEKYGIDTAILNICSQLKSFVQFLGAPEKYNETLTIAAIKIVDHFRLKSTTTSFSDFILQNDRLKSHFADLLAQHYSFDIFNSQIAKRSFLTPDLMPFD